MFLTASSFLIAICTPTAAARALIDQPHLDAEQIVRKSMKIAGDICVYTNHSLVLEKIEPPETVAGAAAVGDAATTTAAPVA